MDFRDVKIHGCRDTSWTHDCPFLRTNDWAPGMDWCGHYNLPMSQCEFAPSIGYRGRAKKPHYCEVEAMRIGVPWQESD